MDTNTDQHFSLANRLLLLPARNMLLLLLVGGVGVFIPSFWNLLAVGLYLAALFNREWRSDKTALHVVNQADEPLAQAIIRVQSPNEADVRNLLQTNDQGVAPVNQTEPEETITLSVVALGYELPAGSAIDSVTAAISKDSAQLTLVQSFK